MSPETRPTGPSEGHYQLWFHGLARHASDGQKLAAACRVRCPDGSEKVASFLVHGLPVAQVAELQALIAGLQLLAREMGDRRGGRLTAHCSDPIVINRVFNGADPNMLGLLELRALAHRAQIHLQELRRTGIAVAAVALARSDAECSRLANAALDLAETATA